MYSQLIGECDRLLWSQATWALVFRLRIFAHFTLFAHRRSAVKLQCYIRVEGPVLAHLSTIAQIFSRFFSISRETSV